MSLGIQTGKWRGVCVAAILLTSTACAQREGNLASGDELESGSETQTQDASESEDPTETETEQEQELSPEDLAEIDGVQSELELIVEGTLDYFAQEQAQEPWHRCPHPNGTPAGGDAGDTPALWFNCNAGPEGKCVPLAGGEGLGVYDMLFWTDNSVWQRVGWQRKEGVPHEFHYNLLVYTSFEGDAACSFTALAQADFDDDAEFSHYSISGEVDLEGATVEDMVVENPFE